MNFKMSNTLPFQAAFEQAPLGMFFSDAEGYLIAVNRAFLAQVQQTTDTLIGSNITTWFAPHTPKTGALISAVTDTVTDTVDTLTNATATPPPRHLQGYYQLRTEQLRTEQLRTEQLRTEQLRTEQAPTVMHAKQPPVWQFMTICLSTDDTNTPPTSSTPNTLTNTVTDAVTDAVADSVADSVTDAVYVTTLIAVGDATNHATPHTLSSHTLSLEPKKVSTTLLDFLPNTASSMFFNTSPTTPTSNVNDDEGSHNPNNYDHDHLRALYDAIPDGILYFDRQGICTDVKQPRSFATYRPYAGTIGKHISSDLSAEDAEQARAALDTLFTSGQTQYFEHAITVDGHTYYRENRFVKINDQTGLALVRDVSDRKQAEQALCDSERLFRSFFEDNPVPCLLVLAENARHKPDAFMLNRAYQHFLGCTADDLRGLTLGQFIDRFMHPADIVREQPFAEEVSSGIRSQYTIEKRYLHSDGSMRWGVLNNLIVRDAEGRFARAIGIVQDITERKQAELEVLRQQEHLLAIYQALPDAIIHLDRQGYYLAFKPPASFVPYDKPEQTIGRHIRDNVPADVAEVAQYHLERLFSTGQPQQFEHELMIQGQLQFRENRLVKLNDNEALAITRDITDRKQAELALQMQTERLQALYQGIPDGIAVISKDGVLLESKPPRSYEPYHFVKINIGDRIEDNAPEHVAQLVRQNLAELFDSADNSIQTYVYSLFTGGETRYREGRLVKLNDHEALSIVRDISEQKQAEQALQTEKEHLRVLYEAIPDTIIRMNRAGVYLDYKPSSYFKPYLNPADTLGKTLSENTPPEVAKRAYEHIDALFATGKMQRFENTLMIDGTVHYRENRWVNIGNDEIIAIVRDITEQKRTEAALKTEKEHLLRLYQAIPEQIIRFDRRGTILDYKPASDFPASTTPEQALGKTLLEVAETPALGADTMHYVEQAFITSEIQSFEQHFVHDGEEHYRDHRMVKVSDDEAITLIRDTTAKRRAEQALQESKQRLDLAIDAAKLGIWDRHIDNEHAQVNHHYRQILGLTPDAPIAYGHMLEGIHPEDRAVVQADFAELYAGTKQYHYHEHRQRHADGSYRWLKVTGAVVERDTFGQPRRFVSVIQDIHEQKTSQLRLEATLVELEQALRDKNILLAEVHHRVKNNMQVIGSIMSLHARDADEPAAKAALMASRARIRAMAAIHEVMYNTEIFSDLEFSVYLQTIARSLVQLHYRDLSQQRGRPLPQLHFDLAPVSLSLQDALPCALIFNELLSNALKHAFPATYTGKPSITIRLQESAADVILSVSDNGVGSSNNHKNFGSFIVDSLVEQLQGKLELSTNISHLHINNLDSDIHDDSVSSDSVSSDSVSSDSVSSDSANTGTTATLRFSKVFFL